MTPPEQRDTRQRCGTPMIGLYGAESTCAKPTGHPGEHCSIRFKDDWAQPEDTDGPGSLPEQDHPDRLTEIKHIYDHGDYITQAEIGWLIGEVERLRAALADREPGHDVQKMVAEFHRVKGAAIAHPVSEWGESRGGLLVEECVELVDAIASGDPVAIMHETADVAYVAFGNAVALGYELAPVLREIHRANMSKASDPDGKLAHKGHKGASYVPADVAGVMVPVALPAKDGAR